MKFNRLGTTDLQVSEICLGTMTWGQQNTEADAHAQLDFAFDHGVNFIDTAEMYAVPISADSQGLTEQYIGTWLAKTHRKRDHIILATKVAGPSDRVSWIRDGNLKLNRHHITQAVDDSLKRLQTDYVDLYQLHWPERDVNNFGQLGYQHHPKADETPLEETLLVLQELVKAGKIRYIGLSNETAWGVMHSIELHKHKSLPMVQSIQNPYSLLNRSYEVALAEISIREQCGLLAYSPLAFGLLTGKYLQPGGAEGRLAWKPEYFSRYGGPQAVAATERYVAIAKVASLTPAQMALAFVNQQPFVTSNIIGATNLEQLKEDIESASIKLSDDILAQIDLVHKEISNPCP